MTLAVSNLTVSYGKTPVIKDASFDLRPGTVTALIGPNGTGKSTLLKAVAGLLPVSGQVALDGNPTEAFSSVMAYMPQDIGAVSSLTALEVVLLGKLGSLGIRVPIELVNAAKQSLNRFGVSSCADKPLTALSGGQRQLVFLAQTLFRDPKVLLLDEPTAALDLRHQLIVLEGVRQHTKSRNLTTVIAMHDLGLAARFADTVLCLAKGNLVAKGMASEVLREDLLRDVYGVETEIMKGSDGTLRITALSPIQI